MGDGWVASGGWDARVRVCDVASDRCLRTLAGHTDAVYSLSLAPGQTPLLRRADI